MSRKSMITINSIVSLEKKHRFNVPHENSETMAVMYEEGMNQVLREIATRHLKYCDGFQVERSEKHECQQDKVQTIFDQLRSKIRDEKLRSLFLELASEYGYLSLIEMDGAYIEGFLAGYRFLKELQPD